MGSKYMPSIKDLKASRRFHTNTTREAAKAAGKSLFVPSLPTKQPLVDSPKAKAQGAPDSKAQPAAKPKR